MRGRLVLVVGIAVALIVGIVAVVVVWRDDDAPETPTAVSVADAFDDAGVAVIGDEGDDVPQDDDTHWTVVSRHVDVMQTGVEVGDGVLGADLDTMSGADVTAGEVPPSYLIAAWMELAESDAARDAASMMPPAEVALDPPALIFPIAVVTLFVADMARLFDEAADELGITVDESAIGGAGAALAGPRPAIDPPSAGPLSRPAGIDPCADVSAFITNTLNAFFNQIRLNENFLGNDGIGRAVGGFFARLVNTAVAIVQRVVTEFTQAAIDQIVAPIQRVLAVVGTILTVINHIRPLPVRLDKSTELTQYGIAGGPAVRGSFAVIVLTDQIDPLGLRCLGAGAPEITNGAGSTVHWRLESTQHLQLDNPTTVIRSFGASPNGFTTSFEPREWAEQGEEILSTAIVHTRTEHVLKHDLAVFLRNQVTSIGPRLTSPVIAAAYDQIVAGHVQRAIDTLGTTVLDSYSTQLITVRHHTPPSTTTPATTQPRPTPPPPPPPPPPPGPNNGGQNNGGGSGGGGQGGENGGGQGSGGGGQGSGSGENGFPERPADGSCTGCSQSLGDPHIVTADAAGFDFQGAGEYTAMLDDDGDFEVQVRQEPVAGGRPVAITTAVAARWDDLVVEARIDVTGTNQGEVSVLVDGADAAVGPDSPRVDLADGARIVYDTGRYGILGPDGTRLVLQVGPRQDRFNVEVQPAAEREGSLTGLFGRWNGDPADELTTRDGDVLDDATFEQIHRVFGESWRIDADASLFTYRDGESTDTFTDPDFPASAMSSAQLDPADRERALDLCLAAGVTDPLLLEFCIVDTVVLGEDGIGEEFAEGQQVLPESGVAAPGPQPDELIGRRIEIGDVVTGVLVGQDGPDRIVHVDLAADESIALVPASGCRIGRDDTYATVERVEDGRVVDTVYVGGACGSVRFTPRVAGVHRIRVEPTVGALDPGDPPIVFGFQVIDAPPAADDPAPDPVVDDGESVEITVAPHEVVVVGFAGTSDTSPFRTLGECTVEGFLLFENWYGDRPQYAHNDCREYEGFEPDRSVLRIHNPTDEPATIRFTLTTS